MKKIRNYLIIFIMITLFVILLVSSNLSLTSEETIDGKKYADNNGVMLIVNEYEHCLGKPDHLNDGYKTCNSIIEVINNKPGKLNLNALQNRFKFDIINKKSTKKQNLKNDVVYYWSNTYENINKLLINETCANSGLYDFRDCEYYVEDKKWINWNRFDNIDKDKIEKGEHIAIKVEYEIPQYDGAYYNFTLKGNGFEAKIDPTISSCWDLWSQNGIYTLTQDIDNDADSCMVITAHNVTLDCAGYYIDGDNGATTGYGISLTNYNDLTVNNCTVKEFYVGIRLDTSTGNIINNSNITKNNGGAGIVLISSSSNQIINTYIDNNDATGADGLALCSSSTNTITHSSITGSADKDVYLCPTASTSNIFLNTTFVTSETSANSNLEVRWYFDAQVNFTHNGTAIENANVSGWDSASTFKFSDLTDSNGQITTQILTEFTETNDVRTYYNNHTFNATYINWDTRELSVNITTNTLSQFNISDTVGPSVIITEPQPQNYADNDTIYLNYSVSDLAVTVDSCWYKVINSTDDIVIDNTTIASCANTTFGLPSGDINYILTLYSNDTFNNLNNDSVSFGIKTNAPSISLDYPSDTSWFDNGTNIQFNFTGTDSDGLDTCKLYGNWSSGWHNNYTWVGPSSGVTNYTTINLTDDNYLWNVWCNDTLNNNDYAANNFTIGVDTIFPTANITSITTTQGSQSITFNHTVTDTNLNTCKYSIFNSSNGIDGIYENVSITCNAISTSATVSSYGTYNLTVYVTDKALNENSSTSSFTTEASPVTPGGGGSDTTSTIIIGQNSTWSAKTNTGGYSYDFIMSEESVRKKFIIYKNLGDFDIHLNITCENTKNNLCQYLNLSNTSLTIEPLTEQKIFFVITLPLDIRNDIYDVNIIAEELGDLSRGTISVRARVGSYSITSWFITRFIGKTTLGGIEFFNFFILILPFVILAPILYYGIFVNSKIKFPLTFLITFLTSLSILILL